MLLKFSYFLFVTNSSNDIAYFVVVDLTLHLLPFPWVHGHVYDHFFGDIMQNSSICFDKAIFF